MGYGLIPQDVIDQVREQTDITQVVSEHLSLSRAGQNLKGLCPFHAEKTPSFMVSPARQIFHCFGCGAGGNVFTFLMKLTGLSFPETVRELARRAGVAIPAPVSDREPDKRSDARERVEKINESAAAWFQRNLLDAELGKEARAYLAGRGIRPETMEAFKLGWAPTSWDGLLRSLADEGFSPSEAALAGLVVPKEQAGRTASEVAGYYDRFRGRVMFPIHDLRRRVIAFGGRVMGDGVPKYLNSPDTPVFQKGRCLYGLDRAREAASRTEMLVIVEGYFDAISLHQAGISNVIATLGTALTPDHVQAIRRFVRRVVLLFDPDPAGVRAALRTLELFMGSGIAVRVVSLPGGEDPDAFVRTHGAESFLTLQERAPSLLDFAVEHCLQGAASGTVEDRIRSVDEILCILQKAEHRIEKEECMRRVAERLGINQRRLIERYPELMDKEPRQKTATAASLPPSTRFKGSAEERDLVHLLLHNRLGAAHVKALRAESFSVPACRRIVEIGLRHLDHDGRVLIRETLDEALADPECATVATELSVLERHYDNVEEHVLGCLDTLERKRCELALGELVARLREAERGGHAEEIRRLNAQVNELRLKKAGLPAAPAT